MASSSKAANDPAVIDLDAAHLTLGTAAANVKILKGINLLRMSNNPVKIEENDILNILKGKIF